MRHNAAATNPPAKQYANKRMPAQHLKPQQQTTPFSNQQDLLHSQGAPEKRKLARERTPALRNTRPRTLTKPPTLHRLSSSRQFHAAFAQRWDPQSSLYWSPTAKILTLLQLALQTNNTPRALSRYTIFLLRTPSQQSMPVKHPTQVLPAGLAYWHLRHAFVAPRHVLNIRQPPLLHCSLGWTLPNKGSSRKAAAAITLVFCVASSGDAALPATAAAGAS